MPSTSTGITANGKSFLFRAAPTNQDSDDDQSIPDPVSMTNENLLRVIRSPPINSLTNYVAGGSDDDDDDVEDPMLNQRGKPQNGHKTK
jgi:hypothetical protein